ncbi:MAG TPA: helical backbone metal receptor [Acidimicrobiia bacterium]|nr:helical backbone metal receptor [Acidimicrobiia bacterium]
MARVVSLVPSVTETLVALGVPPVGCTRFCRQPSIPDVGGTKNPDVAAIADLVPHAVIVNEEENRIEDVAAMEELGLRVVPVSVSSVEEAGQAVVEIAGVADVDPPEEFGDGAWRQWLEARDPVPPGTRVFAPIWVRPWMTLNGATYGSSMLSMLGLDNVFSDASDRYPEVEIPAVQALRPDLVLLPTEPYPFQERHVTRVAEWFPDARVSLIDGDDLFWWGIRTPAALARLSTFVQTLTGPRS